VEIHFGVAFDEAVEEESGEALGLGVGAEAGIEVGGIGFNDEDERGGIRGGAGAGGEEKKRKKQKRRITQRTQRAQSSQRREERGISHFADSVRNDSGVRRVGEMARRTLRLAEARKKEKVKG
jgi:predicted dehydrogenase